MKNKKGNGYLLVPFMYLYGSNSLPGSGVMWGIPQAENSNNNIKTDVILFILLRSDSMMDTFQIDDKKNSFLKMWGYCGVWMVNVCRCVFNLLVLLEIIGGGGVHQIII